MGKGWIKLHRAVRENWLWPQKKYSPLEAWIDLLLTANHSDGTVWIDGKLVTVPRGSLVTSEVKLSTKWQWARKTVRAYLLTLEGDNSITKKSTARYTAITLVNYGLYQDSGTTQGTTQGTTEAQVNTQLTTHKQEVKNVKYFLVRDSHLRLAAFLKERIAAWKPNAKLPMNLHKWADCIRLCMEADKRSEAEIEAVIQWATADSFWQGNILSADALRRNFDKLQAKMMQANPKPKTTDWSVVK